MKKYTKEQTYMQYKSEIAYGGAIISLLVGLIGLIVLIILLIKGKSPDSLQKSIGLIGFLTSIPFILFILYKRGEGIYFSDGNVIIERYHKQRRFLLIKLQQQELIE